ncbi:MAG TPA: hypothetical protein VEZ90_12275 [Blastocatellia bacterium]|nr:hypothetical protein [Blastocatellia bacterium]
MTDAETLVAAILEKLQEQVSIVDHLIGLVPADRLSFRPLLAQTPPPSAGNTHGMTTAVDERPGYSGHRPVTDASQVADTVHLMNLSQLLGHLLECLAGFCALLYKLNPDALSHFQALREKPVNHECSPAEAKPRLAEYMTHINDGFKLMSDNDLKKPVATIFAPAGESVMTLLLGNLEHLINHKHQLFIYLRLLGVQLGTPDLYKLRG